MTKVFLVRLDTGESFVKEIVSRLHRLWEETMSIVDYVEDNNGEVIGKTKEVEIIIAAVIDELEDLKELLGISKKG